MARRILDTTFWDDTAVAELDYPERLLLICMITDESLSNDYGWLPAHPKVLKKHAFGYDACSVVEVETWRNNIFEKCKNVKLYSVNGQEYIDLVKFPEWQKLRYQRKTHLPAPPWYGGEVPDTDIPEDCGKDAETCGKEAQDAETIATTEADSPLGRVVLGSVGKGSVGKGEASASRPRPSSSKNAIRKALEEHFISKTKLPPPLTKTASQKRAAGRRWWAPLTRMAELTDWNLAQGVRLIDEAWKRLDGFTVSAPESLLKTAEGIVGEWARGGSRARDGPQLSPADLVAMTKEYAHD